MKMTLGQYTLVQNIYMNTSLVPMAYKPIKPCMFDKNDTWKKYAWTNIYLHVSLTLIVNKFIKPWLMRMVLGQNYFYKTTIDEIDS